MLPSERKGIIYLVRLHPAGRFKIGFTKDIETLNKRSKDPKTWVPEAKIEGTWPGLEKWERLARFVIASSDSLEMPIADLDFGNWCRQAAGEIVDGADRDVLSERANQLFRHVLTIDNEGK